jgi:hypothetical protein
MSFANDPHSKENSETSNNKTTPTRLEVLCAIWERSQWLKEKIENPRSKLDENLKARVYFVQVEIQAYKAILSGLPEQELEDRVKKLETMLEKGVLIANDQNK